MPSKPKKKYARVKMDGVHVAKIKNRYMFQKITNNSPNGHHYYLVYTDKDTGKNVAVRTTHLYNRDPVRFAQLRQGGGMKLSLPGLETPSMVLKKRTVTNATGKPIDFAHGDVKIKKRISRSKMRKLFRFLK